MRIRMKRLVRSKRGVTPVIAIILLLMMTVAAAGAAYLWITKIQKTITTQAEKQIMTSFQQGTLQVISAYACESNCTTNGERGCDDRSKVSGEVFKYHGNAPESTWGGNLTDEGCSLGGALCFLVRNTGNTVVRMSDLGSAQVVYELPEAPELGERPLMSKTIGATFSGGGTDACCKFSEVASEGKCGNQKSVASRETFIISFFGKFKTSNGESRRMWYSDVKDQRIIVSMNLPSGFKVSHQVV